MGVISTIVQQQIKHDAPYAWFLRDVASVSPIFKQRNLNELDKRLASFVDCLFSNQNDNQIILPKLNLSDWGAVYIMALLCIKKDDFEFLNTVICNIDEQRQSNELRDALICAKKQTVEVIIQKLLCNKNSLVRAAAIESSSYHCIELDNETILGFLIDSPNVIVSVLKYISNNKLICYARNIELLITHNDNTVQFQAAFTGSLLGFQSALTALNYFCFNETPFLKKALSLVYQVINESEVSHALHKVQKSSYSPRIKAHSLAMAGLPDNIPVLIEWMNDPEYAPVAGEAFSFITGVDIEEDDLSILNVELCESRDAPLAEKRRKDRWTEAYEDDLPWPDPELVSDWWQKNQHQFKNGTRYLAGKTLTNKNLRIIVNEGTQTQRISASLILAVMNPSEKVLDVTSIQLN